MLHFCYLIGRNFINRLRVNAQSKRLSILHSKLLADMYEEFVSAGSIPVHNSVRHINESKRTHDKMN